MARRILLLVLLSTLLSVAAPAQQLSTGNRYGHPRYRQQRATARRDARARRYYARQRQQARRQRVRQRVEQPQQQAKTGTP